MGLGTLTLDCLEYPEAAFLTPKQARNKRLAKLSITRKQRRDATRLLPVEVADELADVAAICACGTPLPSLGTGGHWCDVLDAAVMLPHELATAEAAWERHIGDDDLFHGWEHDFEGADPSDQTDDEADAWWAPAGLDDAHAELDDLNDRISVAGIYADHMYGDTLELASNTEEFIANDGFIITRGDFYRRGEPRRGRASRAAGPVDVTDVRDAIRRSRHVA